MNIFRRYFLLQRCLPYPGVEEDNNDLFSLFFVIRNSSLKPMTMMHVLLKNNTRDTGHYKMTARHRYGL